MSCVSRLLLIDPGSPPTHPKEIPAHLLDEALLADDDAELFAIHRFDVDDKRSSEMVLKFTQVWVTCTRGTRNIRQLQSTAFGLQIVEGSRAVKANSWAVAVFRIV